ncbi:hypothetical protein KC19_12G137500 [Ceratodon purpureus]|uniref:PsbP C-terminal domain-containing protein n=1 Tax=Ceratodon purpureus TaxID=3225 RepID=A0A8T0G6Y4_CERPU|nr:hypothetical protein KC19_12G137500 [Ceratodon purpureus]
MVMAMASSLIHSSTILSPSHALDTAYSGTSSKCNGFSSLSECSSLGRSRRGLCLRAGAESARDCGEVSGGACGLRESESGLGNLDRELWEEERFGFESLRWRRRECFLAMAMVGAFASQEGARAEETELAVEAPTLELYVDEKEGFKLLRPALWTKVEKAGATVLFEDPAKRGNTIGVVVNPVRIASLKDFGTPDVVAEKLLAAERKKPSTNDAQLVRVQERLANGDTPLYSLEYTLDSSRGQKKILSAVTVASKKLYILNITYVDSAAAPAPPAMAEAYEQVLNSFDLVV